MAAMTLDANSLLEATATVALSGTEVTLYVKPKTGGSGTYIIALQVSPDGGTTWFTTGDTVSGDDNPATIHVAASHARACVLRVEGAASTVDVWILAR